jgi:hypothetical protein
LQAAEKENGKETGLIGSRVTGDGSTTQGYQKATHAVPLLLILPFLSLTLHLAYFMVFPSKTTSLRKEDLFIWLISPRGASLPLKIYHSLYQKYTFNLTGHNLKGEMHGQDGIHY